MYGRGAAASLFLCPNVKNADNKQNICPFSWNVNKLFVYLQCLKETKTPTKRVLGTKCFKKMERAKKYDFSDRTKNIEGLGYSLNDLEKQAAWLLQHESWVQEKCDSFEDEEKKKLFLAVCTIYALDKANGVVRPL